MGISRTVGRLLVAFLIGLAIVAAVWVVPGTGLGQVPDAALTGGDLLTTPPFDRITLSDGTALRIEPVSPRPLPPYDPSKAKPKPARTRDGRPVPPPEGNVGLPGEPPKVEPKEEEAADEIAIHVLDAEPSDFRVRRGSIRKVEYFEDMLLAQGDRLVLTRQYDKGFEHYLAVRARNPSWTGLDERVDRLLFKEGSEALLGQEGGRGLRLLGELHARRPDYPGLLDKLASAYGTRIARALERGEYVQGRRFLHDLEAIAPDHAVAQQARARFVARAQERVDAATTATGAERVDALVEALRIWPTLGSAASRYPEAFAAVPTLEVAVLDVPGPVGPWVRSPADERAWRLCYLPILARDDGEAAQGSLPGQLAVGVEVADLGRGLRIALRPGLSWSGGSAWPVTAADVARTLADRADPRSPGFRARWADLVRRVEAVDESRVEVRLGRVLLKPEAWLLGPVAPAHAGRDGRVATAAGRRPVGDAAFRPGTAAEGSALFLAEPAEGTDSGPKIRRIIERRLPDASAAAEALVGGDVSLVEHVAPDRVPALARAPDIKVGRYEQPSLHWIALDGRTPALRNRTLRRGMSDAIDRATILEEAVLKRPPDVPNRVADGPFPVGSYADAPGVRPLEHDATLARMLVAAARKEMGGEAIKLTLEFPATPEAQAAAPRIAEALRQAGLEIVPVERPLAALESELRAGRRFDLAYRGGRGGEPVLDAGPRLCPGYDAPPDADGLAALASPRILQLLLQLEQAQDWPSARELVLQIDRETRDELPILPLWQLQDHYAWRTRLRGPGETAEHLYQEIASWEIEPWFAKDPW
jgi:peptide/nickel transport system substrate-binding protein